MTTPTPDELERIQQAILEREVEEALQKERLQKFWQKYKFLILGSIVAIVLGTAGGEIYQNWQKNIRLSESDQFENAVFANFTGDKQTAKADLEALSQTAHTGYGYLAQLKLAGILFEEEKNQDALAVLKTLFDDSGAPSSLKAVARLSYIGHQLALNNFAEVDRVLNPLLKADSAYYASAVELKVSALIQQNQQAQALSYLKSATQNTSLNQDTKNRLDQLVSIIEKQEEK